MGAKSSIEWTDATWSPLRARVKLDAGEIAEAKGYTSLVRIATKMAGRVGQHCEHVSDGCNLCYSGTWQARCLPVNGTGLPFDRRSRDLIDPIVDEKALVLPFKWKSVRVHEERCTKTILGKQAGCDCRDKYRFRSLRIFVENQSDLFGEWVTDEQIDRVFAVMALCPQHTFQILTKRVDRMINYLCHAKSTLRKNEVFDAASALLNKRSDVDIRALSWDLPAWPLPNVWLGVSVENQATADARIPLLIQTPASKRFVSYEPALGPVDFVRWLQLGEVETVTEGRLFPQRQARRAFHWIIVGGESGPGARPFDIAWARSTVQQCNASGVACFVKQLGLHPQDVAFPSDVSEMEARRWQADGWTRITMDASPGPHWRKYMRLKDRKGGDMSEWPEDLRVQEFPE